MQFKTYRTRVDRRTGEILNNQVARYISNDSWLCRTIRVSDGEVRHSWPVFDEVRGQKLEARAKEWAR